MEVDSNCDLAMTALLTVCIYYFPNSIKMLSYLRSHFTKESDEIIYEMPNNMFDCMHRVSTINQYRMYPSTIYDYNKFTLHHNISDYVRWKNYLIQYTYTKTATSTSLDVHVIHNKKYYKNVSLLTRHDCLENYSFHKHHMCFRFNSPYTPKYKFIISINLIKLCNSICFADTIYNQNCYEMNNWHGCGNAIYCFNKIIYNEYTEPTIRSSDSVSNGKFFILFNDFTPNKISFKMQKFNDLNITYSQTIEGRRCMCEMCNNYIYLLYIVNDIKYLKIFDIKNHITCIKTLKFPYNCSQIRYNSTLKILAYVVWNDEAQRACISWFNFNTKTYINELNSCMIYMIYETTHVYFTKNLNACVLGVKYFNPFLFPKLNDIIKNELIAVGRN